MTSATMISGGQQALLYGQGLSFPPRVGPDGAMVWSAGELNVRECICTILRTRPGERVERATWGCGLDRYLFEPNTVATLRLIVEDVQQALTRYEPRIRLDDVTAVLNPDDVRAVDITVSYTLVATGVPERLAMTLQSQG
jgi:phage baseplate assembly protein W